VNRFNASIAPLHLATLSNIRIGNACQNRSKYKVHEKKNPPHINSFPRDAFGLPYKLACTIRVPKDEEFRSFIATATPKRSAFDQPNQTRNRLLKQTRNESILSSRSFIWIWRILSQIRSNTCTHPPIFIELTIIICNR
jgi:hypothetical protein